MRIYGLILAIVFFAAACSSSRDSGHRTKKSQPGQEPEGPEIRAVVFHHSDSASRVFVKIENQNILYKRPDTSSVFYAHLRVHCELLLDGNSRKITDSASAEILDRAGAEAVPLRALYQNFIVDARFANDYMLVVDVTDMNRRSRFRKEVPLHKSSKLTAQNFLISRNDSVLFRNHFQNGEKVDIRFTDTMARQLQAEVFVREFGPALPPFSVKDPDPLKFRPDSVFQLTRSTRNFSLTMPSRGFYHLRAEPQIASGVTLYSFGPTFPGVGGSDEMVASARYIMSRDEYESCLSAPDQKKAIDDFWLNIGGSNERARELLKRYYGRVQEANKQYSSYTQGWKTDRGMIFIVFGRPVNVYKSRKDEIWVYGNEANPATLRFVFNKTENPYSENDFVMERSQFYKEPWHRAVDFWRQGHVYFERGR